MHTRSGFSSITRSGVLFLPIFHTTDRDYSRSIKLHPTGTILVRENSPDRVSFISSCPHFPLSARGRHPSYHASPTSTLRRLHFATLYISGTGSFLDSSHAYNIKYRSGYLRHLIILTGIIFPWFFTPTGIINTPILTKNIQNAILSQPKKQ